MLVKWVFQPISVHFVTGHWREIGARPAKLAACFPVIVPSSGISMSIENAVAWPIPGMLIRISN